MLFSMLPPPRGGIVGPCPSVSPAPRRAGRGKGAPPRRSVTLAAARPAWYSRFGVGRRWPPIGDRGFAAAAGSPGGHRSLAGGGSPRQELRRAGSEARGGYHGPEPSHPGRGPGGLVAPRPQCPHGGSHRGPRREAAPGAARPNGRLRTLWTRRAGGRA